LGGLSKKAFQIESISQDYELPGLKVDGGSLLFKRERLLPGMRQQALITAEGIVKAYNTMGYDAVAVNRLDLAAGLDNLQYLKSKSTFAWLSANLIDKTTKKNLFPPYSIATINKLRIGIIGLTAPGPGDTFPDHDRATIIPWQQALPPLLKELSGQTDMIILLSNYDQQNNRQIARILSEINIIIQAGSSPANREPVLTDNTLICQTGKQGKYLGLLHLTWRPSKTWGDNRLQKQLALKKRELDGINSLYRRTEARIAAAERSSNATLQSLAERRKKIAAEIETLQDSLEQATRKGRVPASYKNRFIAMETTMPDDLSVLQIVEETKNRVNQFNQDIADTATENRQETFTGWKACSDCHRPQTESWQATSHARAYQTLVKKGQQYNLACLPCHVTITMENRDQVTALQSKRLLTLPEQRRQVGCELCHGTGTQHVKDPSGSPMTGRPDSGICLGCHTPEHDDNFNYQIDILKISCSGAH
jgi:hypothetical protein